MPAQNKENGSIAQKPHIDIHAAMKNMSIHPALDVASTRPTDAPIIFPINDIPADSKYSEAEIDTRKKLAAIYRLVDYFKWTQIIYNHITVKIQSF